MLRLTKIHFARIPSNGFLLPFLHYNTRMTSIVSKPPNPERLLNLVLFFNSILLLVGSFLFTFVPGGLWANPNHDLKQASQLLANALFFIGLTSALALYFNVSIHIKRAMSMTLLMYHTRVSWIFIRIVFMERKTFDSAASGMIAHMLAVFLFAFALYRTQNITILPSVTEKISAKIPSIATVPQKEA